jgi:hypothetical protein
VKIIASLVQEVLGFGGVINDTARGLRGVFDFFCFFFAKKWAEERDHNVYIYIWGCK